MKRAVFALLILLLFLPACTLVKTTRCAEFTGWGAGGTEPLFGIFAWIGYAHYRRVAAPADDKQKVDCPMFNPDAMPPKADSGLLPEIIK